MSLNTNAKQSVIQSQTLRLVPSKPRPVSLNIKTSVLECQGQVKASALQCQEQRQQFNAKANASVLQRQGQGQCQDQG